jgi:hypothetical protein
MRTHTLVLCTGPLATYQFTNHLNEETERRMKTFNGYEISLQRYKKRDGFRLIVTQQTFLGCFPPLLYIDMKAFLSSVALLSVLGQATAYNIVDTISGTGFYNAFEFQAISDPTHGRVYASLCFDLPSISLITVTSNYVDQSTAQRLNLTYASGNTFILRADSTTRLSSGGAGRNSVRIRSRKTYNSHTAV